MVLHGVAGLGFQSGFRTPSFGFRLVFFQTRVQPSIGLRAQQGDVCFQADLSSAVIREGVSCDARCWNRARQTPHVAAETHSPDSRNRNMAGHVWLANPRSAGSRCGHRRRTRILVETVVEAVVKPNGFVETVFNVTRG